MGCYQTIKETDGIGKEESLKIHLNLNQPPNQLQHQSTTLKSKKKRKLSRFREVTPSPDNGLEPYWKKGNFPCNLIFLTKSVYQYRIQHIQT